MSSLSCVPLQFLTSLYVDQSRISLRLDSYEALFVTNSLLGSVASEGFHYIFGLEGPDVQFNFRNLFRSLSPFMIRIMKKFSFYFKFNPISM